MIDIKLLRQNLDETIMLLSRRGGNFEYLRDVISLDDERKSLIREVEEIKHDKKNKSKSIGELKKQKKDASKMINEIAEMSESIKTKDEKIKTIEYTIEKFLSETPNIPHPDIPVGDTEEDNLEIKVVGEKPKFSFQPLPHWDLATDLDIIDFDRAIKISGPRFAVYKGDGARLERALISFMMDLHSEEHGYLEAILPYIVNGESMFGTGQFPKFKDDSFKVSDERDLYLNPTAEVPTINLHRDEILKGKTLPLKYVAYTTAFRKEAGSAGRDTRGIIRQHQFNKVELIKFTKPEDSYTELESMLENSCRVLDILKLPYRVVTLCTGDLGFSMRKTYDIEVWLPSYNDYKEIGSISNAEDYQARRAKIRFKRDQKAKAEFVHTLNGSGLAVGRTLVAIMENYQQQDGSIIIPPALVPYMNKNLIKPREAE